MLFQYSSGYLQWHLNTLVDTGDNIYNKFVRHNTVTSVDEQLKEPGFLVRKHSHTWFRSSVRWCLYGTQGAQTLLILEITCLPLGS